MLARRRRAIAVHGFGEISTLHIRIEIDVYEPRILRDVLGGQCRLQNVSFGVQTAETFPEGRETPRTHGPVRIVVAHQEALLALVVKKSSEIHCSRVRSSFSQGGVWETAEDEENSGTPNMSSSQPDIWVRVKEMR
jgi:hypothetical protein